MNKQNAPTLRIYMSPRDINHVGIIFGGVILSHIDLAGGSEAQKYTNKTVVTVTMREVKFLAPVFVGDLVSFYTNIIKTGRTSITIGIEVLAERIADGYKTQVKVTQAEVIYVAVDENRKSVPID